MNTKRLVLAILVVFIGIFATDFLIHGVWLKNTYAETASLWRTEAEMQKYFGWLLLAEFLWAAIFVVIRAKGFPATASLGNACLYGLSMGVFIQTTTLITYVVQPFPAELAMKWFLAGVAQSTLMGVIVFFVYKPKP